MNSTAGLSLNHLRKTTKRPNTVAETRKRLNRINEEVAAHAEVTPEEKTPTPATGGTTLTTEELNEIIESAIINAAAAQKTKEKEEPVEVPTVDATQARVVKTSLSEDNPLRYSVPNDRDEPPGFPICAILTEAINRGATDVYVTPDTPIRFKIKGGNNIYDGFKIPNRSEINRMMKVIIPSAERDIFTSQKELDSSYTLPLYEHAGRRTRLNISAASPGFDNAVLSFRILAGNLHHPKYYGLPDIVLKAMHQANGLIVFSGPTGSGKTTSIASLLLYASREVHRPDANGNPTGPTIITIERPIEYLFDNNNKKANGSLFIQREVGRDTYSFNNAISSAMRQQPNIILIGEVRDAVEMRAALTAATTGHLTLTTVHAEDTAGIIQRLMGAADTGANTREDVLRSIAASGRVFVTQALVDRIDGEKIAVHEVLVIKQSDQALIQAIQGGDIRYIRQSLQATGEDMSSRLVELCREGGPCYVESALKHSPDPNRFWQLIQLEESNGIKFNYNPNKKSDDIW
jgi:pilT